MKLEFYTGDLWEQWGLERRPVIPEGMPVLIDADLLFEDEAGARLSTTVNWWLRELPTSGAPAPKTWKYYAQILREWMVFLSGYGVDLFDERARLKAALSSYSVYRFSGPIERRFEATTWNQHMSVLGSFYRWAIDEGYTSVQPFTYRQAMAAFGGGELREVSVNQATVRAPKPHVTIRYLEPDFSDLLLKGLAGLDAAGRPTEFKGRETTRNEAVVGMALSAGLRCQEFTYLLGPEVPPLPKKPTDVPIPFPVPPGVTKGRKYRSSWIAYADLARVHQYLQLSRPLVIDGSAWRPPPVWGEPLFVTEVDALGGRVNGTRVRWAELRPAERRRLVAPGGGTMLIAAKPGGGPFTAWPTVLARTALRIRETIEPRFPHVEPHRLRHSFAMATMTRLVSGYYAQVARVVKDTDFDAAWVLYLRTTEPLAILRDLLGHSSVLTTEKYLNRLDMTRIFREADALGGRGHGRAEEEIAAAEADNEFDGEDF